MGYHLLRLPSGGNTVEELKQQPFVARIAKRWEFGFWGRWGLPFAEPLLYPLLYPLPRFAKDVAQHCTISVFIDCSEWNSRLQNQNPPARVSSIRAGGFRPYRRDFNRQRQSPTPSTNMTIFRPKGVLPDRDSVLREKIG
jgi:hypothetical protein